MQSGKQCLCRYMLPPLCKGLLTHISELPDAASVSHESKIIGLTDAVEERLNIITNNGQVSCCVFNRIIIISFSHFFGGFCDFRKSIFLFCRYLGVHYAEVLCLCWSVIALQHWLRGLLLPFTTIFLVFFGKMENLPVQQGATLS